LRPAPPQLPSRPPELQTLTLPGGERVWIAARARLPTEHGVFEIVAFENTLDGLDHVALVRGEPSADDLRPWDTRLHSECLTGDALASVRCDCRAQLSAAQAALGEADRGVLLYMRQEGRGIGLANKIRAYALQDQGLDTVDANLHLGFDDDLRDYSVAGAMLQLLGVQKIRLRTNNPRKVFGLKAAGVEVTERLPHRAGERPENAAYLATKRDRSGHLL